MSQRNTSTNDAYCTWMIQNRQTYYDRNTHMAETWSLISSVSLPLNRHQSLDQLDMYMLARWNTDDPPVVSCLKQALISTRTAGLKCVQTQRLQGIAIEGMPREVTRFRCRLEHRLQPYSNNSQMVQRYSVVAIVARWIRGRETERKKRSE